MCVPRTCYCDDTINWAIGSRGCIALVEHATKGKKHAEKVALRRYLHNIKLKIMLGSSDRKMNLETEIPVMTHCKEPALTSKMTLTFFESVNGLILY